jgi:hypothetical protein
LEVSIAGVQPALPAKPAGEMPARADALREGVQQVQVIAEPDEDIPEFAPRVVHLDNGHQARLIFRQNCLYFMWACLLVAGACLTWIPLAAHLSSSRSAVQANATFGMYDFQPDVNITFGFDAFAQLGMVRDWFYTFSPHNPVNQANVHGLLVGQSSVDADSVVPGLIVVGLFPTLAVIGMFALMFRRRDYVHYRVVGSAYREAKWRADCRVMEWRMISKSSPDFVSDAKYLVYRVSEVRDGVQQPEKDVVISYALFTALGSLAHTRTYTNESTSDTIFSGAVRFAATCKQINIAAELEIKLVSMNTCKFWAAYYLKERFGGGDLNVLRR